MISCCTPDPKPDLPELDVDEVAMLCKALAHPARVQLLRWMGQLHGVWRDVVLVERRVTGDVL